MIPSIITKKTFPGCVRSFIGFPVDPDGETSSLLYLVCVILKLRQNTRPWSALPKINKRKEESVTAKFGEKVKLYLDGTLDGTADIALPSGDSLDELMKVFSKKLKEDIQTANDFRIRRPKRG